MNLEKSFISRIEFLVPSAGLHALFTAGLMGLHAVVLFYLVSSIGEPYRLVIQELTEQAALEGKVLTVESIESTDENPIPGEFSPHPASTIALIASLGLHALFVLIQRWSVSIRVRLQFKRVKSLRSNPTHVCVSPPEFRGKTEIIHLTRNRDELDSYVFSFQRRKFQVTQHAVRELSFPLDRRVVDFVSSNQSITNVAELQKRQSLYGLNTVDIPVPPFWKLYMDQLLSPIPIFQLFCSALWMMDEYWKYTIFTLLSIFGFEVSTTMQRKKSLETLRSMSGKSIVPLEAFRMGKWCPLSSDQLVPGDRIRFPSLGSIRVVPCDCLIIGSGSAVVNEASLTGESVPQMKDPIDTDRTELLEISGRDRIHCLFSGTNIVRADPGMELIVLRTGSQSSQGELLRMVEFSQQDVSGDKKDTMYLLLLLLVLALAAASYVVYERVAGTGSENLTKMKTHKLMLRVIMIITSVVPPELPMQMALSVNTALMALHKIGIFCTEPFRVPMAGGVTHCFFDKTGTLTSDQLKCLGFNTDDVRSGSAVDNENNLELVVASCHSLIEVDAGRLIGDPIEQTALEAIGWTYIPKDNMAISPERKREIKIIHRFHFSSALQRMSCVVSEKGKHFSVVKGSPEVILSKLADVDEGFKSRYLITYSNLARNGMRVLAMAFKPLPNQHVHREEAESDLKFAGFGTFACETRADTAMVIKALSSSADLPCIMITGDALLTAMHVAEDVGIIRKPPATMGHVQLKRQPDGGYLWEVLCGVSRDPFPFDPEKIWHMSKNMDLVVSGEDIPEDENSPVWTHAIPYMRVLARMSPQQKERVIATFSAKGHKPLMCGDGGNDVGALKQAEVGVALLAGFGAANTQTAASAGEDDALSPEDQLEKENRIVQIKERVLAEKMKAEFAVKKKEVMAKQQEWLQEELARPGNAGYWASIKTVTGRMREELATQANLLQAKYGVQNAWDKKSTDVFGSGKAAEDASKPVVQMGDASVAAPFTSRAPSIRSVIQIIKQGRCTLLVAVQMMQIMMLESIISAFTFAAITMEGGRSTEIQLIGSSVFVMIASFAFTYAKPSMRLSNVIPLKSVFSPAIFISVILQVTIQLSVLVYAMSWAKSEMGPDALSDLYAFERDRDERLSKLMRSQDESADSGLLGFASGLDMWSMFKSVPYRPNLLNTVMFLVKTSQQVSVLVVNYKGSPWMQGALENKALFLSMFMCSLGIAVCSTGCIPWLNDTLELLVLPGELRNKLLMLLALSSVGALLVDRLVVLIFARKIFIASTLKPVMSTRVSDFVPLLKTCGYILAGLVVAPIILGNPIGIIGAIYAYKQNRKWQKNKELAEIGVAPAE